MPSCTPTLQWLPSEQQWLDRRNCLHPVRDEQGTGLAMVQRARRPPIYRLREVRRHYHRCPRPQHPVPLSLASHVGASHALGESSHEKADACKCCARFGEHPCICRRHANQTAGRGCPRFRLEWLLPGRARRGEARSSAGWAIWLRFREASAGLGTLSAGLNLHNSRHSCSLLARSRLPLHSPNIRT
jgi:hypothetical protein